MKRIVVIFICLVFLNCKEKELEAEVDYVAKYKNKIVADNELFQKNKERNIFYVFNSFIEDFLIKPQEVTNEEIKIANMYNHIKLSNYDEKNKLILSESLDLISQSSWSDANNKDIYDWITLNSENIKKLSEYIYKSEYFFYPEFYISGNDIIKPTYPICIPDCLTIIDIIVTKAFYKESNIDDFIEKVDPLLELVTILSNENSSYNYPFHSYAIKKCLLSIKNILEVDTSVSEGEKAKVTEVLDYLMDKNTISVFKIENYLAEKNFTTMLCDDLKYPEDGMVSYNIFVDRVLSENRFFLNSIENLNADTFIDNFDTYIGYEVDDKNFTDKILMFMSKKRRDNEVIRLISEGHLSQMRMILLTYKRNSKLVELIENEL